MSVITFPSLSASLICTPVVNQKTRLEQSEQIRGAETERES